MEGLKPQDFSGSRFPVRPQQRAPIVNQADGDVRMAAAELEELARTNRNRRMPEEVFACIFLPMFYSGEVHPQYKADMATWVNIAGNGEGGGGYKEVDVIDKKGNVIYSVPAIFNHDAIKSQPNSKNGIMSAVINADHYAGLHPALGTQHLEQELAKREIFSYDPTFFAANAERWNAIFIRYGYPTIGNVVVPEVEAKQKEKESVTDYDDWAEA